MSSTCQMIVGHKSSKENPVDFEDFDIDIPCGKPAEWCFKSDDHPTVCDGCFCEMIIRDPEIARDYLYGDRNGPTPSQVLEKVKERLDQFQKEGFRVTPPQFETEWIGPNRFTIRKV